MHLYTFGYILPGFRGWTNENPISIKKAALNQMVIGKRSSVILIRIGITSSIFQHLKFDIVLIS